MGEAWGGVAGGRCVSVCACVCVRRRGYCDYSQYLPSTTLNHAAIKKKKRKQTTLSGPHNARGPDDVICHLQLMKVMMTCMSAAYVHHLLGSTTLELLPTMLQRGVEARLYHSASVPRHVWRTAACILMTRHQFNHTATLQAAKVTRLWATDFISPEQAGPVSWYDSGYHKKNHFWTKSPVSIDKYVLICLFILTITIDFVLLPFKRVSLKERTVAKCEDERCSE